VSTDRNERSRPNDGADAPQRPVSRQSFLTDEICAYAWAAGTCVALTSSAEASHLRAQAASVTQALGDAVTQPSDATDTEALAASLELFAEAEEYFRQLSLSSPKDKTPGYLLGVLPRQVIRILERWPEHVFTLLAPTGGRTFLSAALRPRRPKVRQECLTSRTRGGRASVRRAVQPTLMDNLWTARDRPEEAVVHVPDFGMKALDSQVIEELLSQRYPHRPPSFAPAETYAAFVRELGVLVRSRSRA